MINRHNYEEFFLLYVDNELVPEERSAVEIFIQQNPDLAAEMEMLQQATLQGDPIKFEQKELLYNQAEGVTLENYEEYFLLSVDKELTGKEIGEVEKFVLQHPELQNEYVVLQKTKLEPEAIQFEGKKKLYKNQEKERGVLLSPWFRMSVAAAVITLAIMTWIFNNKQGQSIQPLVTAQGAKKIKAVPVNPTPPVNIPGGNEPVVTAPKGPLPATSGETTTKVRKKGKEKSTVNDVADNFVKIRTPQTVLPAAQSAVVSENPTIKAPLSAPVATATAGNKNSLPVVGEEETVTPAANSNATDYSNSIAKHVVYREIASQDDEEEKSFFIGSAEINKNKLKGLFKKAAGIFGKKNDKEDGERSLRIASFEIRSN